ncbi:MAG: hypothetical protein DHS20C16_33720 [Phycisphaerae bacterium]|nr:MAG: hypothetical protein DHS20C16_33720 [Phycisphaerae bacterium]
MPSQTELCLLQVLFNAELFGREILDKYEMLAGRKLPIGTLYTTLDRMEQKGFVKSRFGKTTASRGTNRRKFFKISAKGHSALEESAQLWSQLGGRVSGA